MMNYGLAPKLIHIEVTSRCNLRCPQCYNFDSGRDIDPEVLSKVIKEAASLGVETIALSGGEPLLYPEIFSVIKTIKNYGMISWMATSGKELTAGTIDQLIADGLGCLFISLNGSTKEIHGKSRGGYQETLLALEELKKTSLPYEINWVARSDNVDDFSELVKLASYYKVYAVNVLVLKPDLHYKLNYSLNREQLLTLANQIIKLRRQGVEIRVEPCFSQLRTLLGWNKDKNMKGCVAGVNLMAIDVCGKKMPCRHLHRYVDSDAKDLMHYWNHSEVLKSLRNVEDNIKKPCNECFRLKECLPCRAAADKLYGLLDAGEENCPIFNFYCNLHGE